MRKKIEWFFTSNDTLARLLRTILEAGLAFLIANIDVLFAGFTIPPTYKTVIMGFVVAVVSPILASLRGKEHEGVEDKTSGN